MVGSFIYLIMIKSIFRLKITLVTLFGAIVLEVHLLAYLGP